MATRWTYLTETDVPVEKRESCSSTVSNCLPTGTSISTIALMELPGLILARKLLGLAIADAPASASYLLPAMNPLTSRASKICAFVPSLVTETLTAQNSPWGLEGRDPPEVVIPHLTEWTTNVKEPSLTA